MSRFRTRYDRRRLQTVNDSPSMTLQSDYPDTLIPNIMAQHGVQPMRSVIFGDFSNLPTDYAELDAYMREAQEQFLTLPSDIRDRFEHDPMKLLRFLGDSNNRVEAISLGLVKPDVSPAAPAAPGEEPGSTSAN